MVMLEDLTRVKNSAFCLVPGACSQVTGYM
jgi:hypothetical protein